jgi:hypothetical protein
VLLLKKLNGLFQCFDILTDEGDLMNARGK